MKKIDRETVQRILDTADIVEVVSDFVTLKRRGANYIGLCPFHNERTPSFSVSKSKGICKCFSCGKGGSPVNFLMELESMTYQEALRYLARKYNIEIKEHEMTDAEKQRESERESMLAVNAWAMDHFASILHDNPDGRAIGLSYFRQRGISDAMITRFRLGYALDRGTELYDSAIKAGFSEDYLVATGLCSRSDRGIYDRFRGRVIYPVLSVSGKVVAFGGRTLRSDKSMAKYVNSPESVIYSKRRELYGLYQARQAIVKADKCILVEGYMDVISMHQAGVENVVASSGTSLTAEQVRLIHRFTGNITVIYDADSAGIKAALRSIDMLLLEGMDIKVLSLPPGEDPDSFAQTHSSTEVEQYIADNEIDFIRYRINTLLKDRDADDPMKRARVVNDIIRSISLVSEPVKRNIYITECSRLLGIDDKVLTLQVAKIGADQAEKLRLEAAREREMQRLPADSAPSSDAADRSPQQQQARPQQQAEAPVDPAVIAMAGKSRDDALAADSRILEPLERELTRLLLRYAMVTLTEATSDDGTTTPVTVLRYIYDELTADEIVLSTPVYNRILQLAVDIENSSWPSDRDDALARFAAMRDDDRRRGIEEIRLDALELGAIKAREQELETRLDNDLAARFTDFCSTYLERILASSPDDAIRRVTTELISDRHVLSKVHTKYAKVVTEIERLHEVVPLAVYGLKAGIIDCRTIHIRRQLKEAAANPATPVEVITDLMRQNVELDRLKVELAHYLGERIIVPR